MDLWKKNLDKSANQFLPCLLINKNWLLKSMKSLQKWGKRFKYNSHYFIEFIHF